MRILFLIVVFLTLACSNKDNSKGVIIDSLNRTYTDGTLTKNNVSNESIRYIGFIDKFYFSNDNEAYVELYFIKDQINANEYEKIVNLADSLIYQDNENSRHKFPDTLAKKYFDLRGLSKLIIYDKNNDLFCNADFIRVEYLNQNISSLFIAVFKTDKLLKEDTYYAISNFNGIFEQINHKVSKDMVMTQNVLTKLNEQKPYDRPENYGCHLSFPNGDSILSIINAKHYA